MLVTGLPTLVNRAVSEIGEVLLGKEQTVRQALCCLLTSGHLLLEDLPGMGKTTLAHALADVLGLSYARVQFTSDLLPSDILGVSVFNRNEETFQFRPGPIFNQLLLADEINRATPRTQSALLEAMTQDKKVQNGTMRFILAHGLGDTFIADDVDEDMLRAFLLAQGAQDA